VFTDFVNSIPVLNLKLPLDLNQEVKANKVDLSKLDPSIMKGIQAIGGKGELYGLPFYSEKFVLFYNKDLFNKFGVPYPTDNMTYDDLLGTIKRVTRVENGVSYAGMGTHNLQTTGTWWGIPVLNEKTGKADFQTDSWKRMLGLLKEIRTIPGNEKGDTTRFYKDQTQAMHPQMANIMLGYIKTVNGSFNWDMVPMPQLKEYPGISGALRPSYLIVSQVSKYKQQAAAAVSYLATSDEFHLLLAKNGKLPPVNIDSANDPLAKQFGSDVPLLKGKNVPAIFQYKSAPLPYITEYDKIAATELNKAEAPAVNGTQDINTALRNVEEAANKLIDEQKRAK
jgi:multiple sugar transport system substrate-binding protein